MIKAVLLDLDDTLISTGIDTFFPLYLKELGRFVTNRNPALGTSETFIQQLMASFNCALGTYDPASSLHERLMQDFAARTSSSLADLEAVFNAFYNEQYPALRPHVRSRPSTARLLKWLSDHNYRVVVATNPGLPWLATSQRMAWGGIPASNFHFELITCLEEMHFGKPSPEYYAEIVVRLDIHPCEAIMVGDSWNDDMVGAAGVGMHTFWITEDGAEPPDRSVTLNGHGSYEQFVAMVESGWLDTIDPHKPECEALIARLAAFPAAIDALRRGYSRDVLECRPSEREWSIRDITCHLRDHEIQDRERLQRILNEHDPFLSAVTDPWGENENYLSISMEDALAGFIRNRAETVAWLKSLPNEAWERPARDAIFGPTCFSEMVRFVISHDRTHLHQMRDAIAYAVTVCG